MKIISMISICLILVACEPTKKTVEIVNTEQVAPIESAEVEQVAPIESAEVEELAPIESAEVEDVTSVEIVSEEEIPQVEKGILVWQNVSGISNSNFYKVVAQKLFQEDGVVYTNVLQVAPSADATAGIITIPLNKKYNSFFTRVCVVVDNPWPYETITIFCDGQERESIKKIGPKNAPRNLNINTENVDVLTIKVKPGRKGYYEKVIFFDSILKIND